MQPYLMMFIVLLFALTVFVLIPCLIHWVVGGLANVVLKNKDLLDFRTFVVEVIAGLLMLFWVFCVFFAGLMSMPIPGKNPSFSERYVTEGVYPALWFTGTWFIIFFVIRGICVLCKRGIK